MTGKTDVWTIARLLDWTADYFMQRGLGDARLSAEILLAHAAGCRRIDLYVQFDREPATEVLARFREWVRRAAQHEPVAYLVGEKEFFSLPFEVSPAVLIPRPETETLVQCALDRLEPTGTGSVLDVGTGSGCVVVAILSQRPDARAVATDISEEALAVAGANAARHGVLERLTLLQADGLDLQADSGTFDLVVSNPPYVAAGELARLDPAVRDFEPAAALSDGEDGLSFYRLFGRRARDLLAADGVLLLEIADGALEAVTQAVEEPKKLQRCGVWNDSVVGSPRVVGFVPTQE